MEKPLLHVMVYGIYIFMGFIYHLYIIYIQFNIPFIIPCIYHLITIYIPFIYHLYYHLYTI